MILDPRTVEMDAAPRYVSQVGTWLLDRPVTTHWERLQVLEGTAKQWTLFHTPTKQRSLITKFPQNEEPQRTRGGRAMSRFRLPRHTN